MMICYDKKGKKISVMEWGELHGDRDYTIIKRDTLPDGKIVSTVWLGMNHNFGIGKPLIFETMVFPSKGNFSDIDCERYATEKKALAGHKLMVDKYTKIVKPIRRKK